MLTNTNYINREEALSNRLRRAYFYIDYLRLHRMGKELQLFPKNRQMMDPSEHDHPKKGFKAYIFRMLRTFIDHDFKYMTCVQPRNQFGYNFGYDDKAMLRTEYNQNDGLSCVDMFKSPQDMLFYMFRRHLLYRENNDVVSEYYNTLSSMTKLQPRTNNMFYYIRFGATNPAAFIAVKEMYKIKDQHAKIIDLYDPTICIKNSIFNIMSSITKMSRGQKFYNYESGGILRAATELTVDRIDITTNREGYVTGAQVVSTEGRRYSRSNILASHNGESDILEELTFVKDTIDQFIESLIGKVKTSRGLDLLQIFNFHKMEYTMHISDKKKDVLSALSWDEIEPKLLVELQNQDIPLPSRHIEAIEEDREEEAPIRPRPRPLRRAELTTQVDERAFVPAFLEAAIALGGSRELQMQEEMDRIAREIITNYEEE